jgi:predicted  nucleic acid-binding Zn-ribbon protein
MADFDEAELEQINVVKLKARRAGLRHSKKLLKERASSMTPQLRQQLDEINAEITWISKQIHEITGEYE